MPRKQEITDEEFKEIVIGEYGPNIEAIRKQVTECLESKLSEVGNDVIDTYNLLVKQEGSDKTTYQQLLSAFNENIMHMNSLGEQICSISKTVSAKDFKIVLQKRTFNEKGLGIIVIILTILVLTEPYLLLYLLSL